MEVSQVIEANAVLEKFLKEVHEFEVSYALAVLQSKLEIAVKNFYKARDALIEKYGEEPDKSKPEHAHIQGKFISVTSPNYDTFVEEVNKLLSTSIDIEFKPLSLNVLKHLNISGEDLKKLLPFIE